METKYQNPFIRFSNYPGLNNYSLTCLISKVFYIVFNFSHYINQYGVRTKISFLAGLLRIARKGIDLWKHLLNRAYNPKY
jgi:hypothetical protein